MRINKIAASLLHRSTGATGLRLNPIIVNGKPNPFDYRMGCGVWGDSPKRFYNVTTEQQIFQMIFSNFSGSTRPYERCKLRSYLAFYFSA